MVKNKQLVPRKTSGLKKIIELVKSINPNYVLNQDSPESLWKKRKRVIHSIKHNCDLLNLVPEEIIMSELALDEIPAGGIIETAFENGYVLSDENFPPTITGMDIYAFLSENLKRNNGIPPRYFPVLSSYFLQKNADLLKGNDTLLKEYIKFLKSKNISPFDLNGDLIPDILCLHVDENMVKEAIDIYKKARSTRKKVAKRIYE